MAYWLIKSEPFKYSWDQFEKDGFTFWDGVRNYAARNNLRSMKKGDLAFFYHSNEGLAIVGIAKVIKDALMIHIINENKQTEINEMEAMIATCQEFMSSFIILGYDLNRQPISPIVFAHNQQEADALGAYMSKFINHNIKEIDPSAEQ